MEETKEYIGMWLTANGYIRHKLLPNNRYDEARGNRKSAYQGSYKVTGNHIDYKDNTGFTADGKFKDGVLYHAGMILYKKNGRLTSMEKTFRFHSIAKFHAFCDLPNPEHPLISLIDYSKVSYPVDDSERK